jgi:glycosyltransferase involved in cell wall biosynthesis
LSAAQGFVMPSLLETPSIAALEAAAYGKPLLITKVGSTMEYFGPHAIYVDPDNVQSMVDGFSRLLMETATHSLVSERAKQFTWEASATSLNNIYKETLE